jgi:hypothetical protein
VERATRAATPSASPAATKAFENALASIAPAVRSNQHIRTWVGATRGENGRTHMTLVWEPITGPPGARREAPGRVSIIAARETGELVYRGRSAGEAPAPGATPAGRTGGPPSGPTGPQKLEFDAPPGPMELRLSLEAAGGGGVLDNDIRKITVPDLTAAQTHMSTPRVFKARTAREMQNLMQDAAAVPVAAREFSRTERLLIRFDAYGAGTEMPMASAALLTNTGQKVTDVTVTPAAAGGTHQIDLGLNSIAPGEYVVEITVGGGASEAVKELVAIRVGG